MARNKKKNKIWELVRNTFQKFREENTMGLAAALAYYTIFSLPPILIIIVHSLSFFLKRDVVQAAIAQQITAYVGQNSAQELLGTINKAFLLKPTIFGTTISLIALFFTSTSLFSNIQNSLNLIFRVRAKYRKSYLKLIRDRSVSFGMILALASILMASLALEAGLKVFAGYIDDAMPRISAFLVHVGSHMVVFMLVTILFGMIFKFLPDAKIKWNDTLIGAMVTSVLFSMGKILIGYYLSRSNISTVYDAAGSILVILVWVYYTAVIFYFGAQFTYVYSRFYGSHIRPASYAVRLIQKEVEIDEEAELERTSKDS